MQEDKGFNLGKKNWLLMGVVLGGMALLVLIVFVLGSLNSEGPWLTPSEKVAVVAPKSGFTLKAGAGGSGLKTVRVTVTQAGQEKVVVDCAFLPGARRARRWRSPFPWIPRPWD